MWYVFKAPQRKFGIQTLYNDLKGIGIFIFRNLLPKKTLKPVSICVGIYNRSETFLTNFLPSLSAIEYLKDVELSVFDCGSTDIENLEENITRIYKGKLTYRVEPISFSRAKAFNQAVGQSNHELIFICDADFSLPSNLVQQVNNLTGFKEVWFPIVFYLYKDKPAIVNSNNGEWMQWGGKGILACTKKAFNEVGKLNEKFTTWGYEDEELWERFHKKGYVVIRNRCKGLLHHWHPSLNPKYKLK